MTDVCQVFVIPVENRYIKCHQRDHRMGKFVTKTGNDGQFYFNLKTDNGQVIISSQGYNTAAAMQNGIDSLKTNAPEDSRYERLNASNDKFYFKLKAASGQVIGKSQMYESETDRDKGIESVKANAPEASVEGEGSTH